MCSNRTFQKLESSKYLKDLNYAALARSMLTASRFMLQRCACTNGFAAFMRIQ